MNILLDANVLLRLADPTSATHAVAAGAILALRIKGDTLYITPQCIYEFWAVAARPISNNGLGLSPAECVQEIAKIKGSFLFLNDKPALFVAWEAAVSDFACQGKVAHDARYVAAAHTHGLAHLLTFNVGDFVRFSGITLLDPNTVAVAHPASQNP